MLATASLSGCVTNAADDADVSGIAAFYPLEYVLHEVGGEHVEITNLTASGAEPHDLELSPRQMADISHSDLVVYLGGFQPAVDQAIEQQAADKSVDVASIVHGGHDDEHEHDHGEEGHDHDHGEDSHDHGDHDNGEDGHDHDHDHGEDGHDHDHDHDHGEDSHDHGDHSHDGENDPHVWLDPTKMVTITEAVSQALVETDPQHAEDYKANAESLEAGLTELDEKFQFGLAECKHSHIVTPHAAFTHLVDRYGLEQESVTGINPHAEASPGAIANVVEYVKDNNVETIFYGPLVDPAMAETVASETDADTAILDPVESVDASSGKDYMSIMESNLTTLRKALECQA